MPQKQQDQGDQSRFQQPDPERLQPAQQPVVPPYVPEQQTGRRRDAHSQEPQWPGGEEHKLAFMKKRRRVFEEEFEHGATSEAHESIDARVVGGSYRRFRVEGNLRRGPQF